MKRIWFRKFRACINRLVRSSVLVSPSACLEGEEPRSDRYAVAREGLDFFGIHVVTVNRC